MVVVHHEQGSSVVVAESPTVSVSVVGGLAATVTRALGFTTASEASGSHSARFEAAMPETPPPATRGVPDGLVTV